MVFASKYRGSGFPLLLQVSLLNFFVTPEGLEEQLLGTTVAHERPDLANMKNQLVLSNARMKKELKDIEDKILFMLSNSQVLSIPADLRQPCLSKHGHSQQHCAITSTEQYGLIAQPKAYNLTLFGYLYLLRIVPKTDVGPGTASAV